MNTSVTQKLEEKLDLSPSGLYLPSIENTKSPEESLKTLYKKVERYYKPGGLRDKAIKLFGQEQQLVQELLQYIADNGLDDGYLTQQSEPLGTLNKLLDEEDKPEFVVNLRPIGVEKTIKIKKTLWGHKKINPWTIAIK